TVDQKRYVIEQLIRWEHTIGVERHPAGDPVQPLCREIVPGSSQSLGQNPGQRTIIVYFRLNRAHSSSFGTSGNAFSGPSQRVAI
ncbi:MAG: hypothetical protein ACJ8AB_11895, partial [Gemmatimonadaceae bacterium]